MIVLYSGTPGSGKSLDCARTIYNWCRRGNPIICNFPINIDNIKIKGNKDIRFVTNDELTPDYLVETAKEHFAGRRVKEDSILLIIDEAQLLFNARDWTAKGRDRWTWFFTMHRHFGYLIILCAQFDRMLDRQVRCLIEYEYIHRKVKNMGWRGWLLSFLFLSPFSELFVKVKIWYPMKERIDCDFYKASPRFYRIYDTFELIEAPGSVPARSGGTGAPRSNGALSGAESGKKAEDSNNNLNNIERICKDEEKVS